VKLELRWALGLLAVAAGLVVAGVAMVYVPAALVLAGLALGAGVLYLVDVPEPGQDNGQ